MRASFSRVQQSIVIVRYFGFGRVIENTGMRGSSRLSICQLLLIENYGHILSVFIFFFNIDHM